MIKLHHGIHQFRSEIHDKQEEFFLGLARKQSPDAVFITCSDSRIDPNLLTQSLPGELFILRNAGNIVSAGGAEEASIEYALTNLGVKDIIVCGHSQCGAMQGLLDPASLSEMPAVSRWLQAAERTREVVESNYKNEPAACKLSIAIQENVLVQLENIRQLPCVARRLWSREVELHGWVYEIETGGVFVYDPVHEEFLLVDKGVDGYELVPGTRMGESGS